MAPMIETMRLERARRDFAGWIGLVPRQHRLQGPINEGRELEHKQRVPGRVHLVSGKGMPVLGSKRVVVHRCTVLLGPSRSRR
jgi:hypothetical protein